MLSGREGTQRLGAFCAFDKSVSTLKTKKYHPAWKLDGIRALDRHQRSRASLIGIRRMGSGVDVELDRLVRKRSVQVGGTGSFRKLEEPLLALVRKAVA